MKRIPFFILTALIFVFSVKAQEFPKAILSGDYPDPTILRDGDDFYMTHSPFYYQPGFLIWHSKDLQNWKPVCRAMTQWNGSAMAPDLVKHRDKYYIYYPAAGTNFVIWADNINGKWSEPIDLKVKGIDPGHIVGEDGKRYLFLSDGYMVELTDDGLATIGESEKVYDGWEYPKNWKTECMCLESPKLNYRDGYFYMTSAEGGTAGPATSHLVVSARSKSVKGPWENSPYNPIVHTYSDNENWWSKGHGTLIDDANGAWWIVYHAYSNGFHTLGRQTLIEPIEWTKDGWFRQKQFPNRESVNYSQKQEMEKFLSDSFSDEKLGLQWTFWKEYAPASISLKQNILSLKAKGATPADARLLLATVADKVYETQVEIMLEAGNSAGLILFYNEKAFAGIVADSKNFTVYKDANNRQTVPNTLGKQVFLKIINRGNHCMFLASNDNQTWKTLAANVDVSAMHHNNYKGFYALRTGLLSAGKGTARFRDFRYKNAVPQEKDMGAYLFTYFKDDTHGLYFALSKDGYSFTDVNNGNPIMAGDTVAQQKGIRDPHITRGPDVAFYLAMTDLHIFGQRMGYRTTRWERDDKYQWGNNRGFVLMKSFDLINWTRSNVIIEELFPGLDVGCAWAPETIYDSEENKMMIYFTMRLGGGNTSLYYSYTDNDFTKLVTFPQPLFNHPDPKIQILDADITPLPDGTFVMMYVSQENPGGIRMAKSDKINRGYQYDTRRIDFEQRSCEAPNVWKRIGEDKWVVMYDIFSINPHNFGFAETTDFETFTDIGHFGKGIMQRTNFEVQKHGAIIQLTADEAEQLAKHWKLNMKFTQEKEITVSNLEELSKYLNQDGNKVRMKPGIYKMKEYLNEDSISQRLARGEREYLNFSGNYNTFIFEGVTFEIDTELRKQLRHPIHTNEIIVTGNSNTLKGLTIIHTGNTTSPGGATFCIDGQNNTIYDFILHVKGSFPYGYGDLFGKGGPDVIRHQKHSGFLINGSRTKVYNTKLYMKSFGHGFYIQKNASDIHLENCLVEGETRTTDDVLKETEGPAFDVKFRTWTPNREGEYIVTPGYMKSLCEDGFRTYTNNNKNITFINCTAKNTRGGFELRTRGGGIRLEGCTTIGTERGYWVNTGAIIKNCKGDANYGPLLFVEGNNITVDLQVVADESDRIVHSLATIQGRNNRVVLRPYNGQNRKQELPILVGYTHPEHGESMSPYSEALCESLELINETSMPVVLGKESKNCKINNQ